MIIILASFKANLSPYWMSILSSPSDVHFCRRLVHNDLRQLQNYQYPSWPFCLFVIFVVLFFCRFDVLSFCLILFHLIFIFVQCKITNALPSASFYLFYDAVCRYYVKQKGGSINADWESLSFTFQFFVMLNFSYHLLMTWRLKEFQGASNDFFKTMWNFKRLCDDWVCCPI